MILRINKVSVFLILSLVLVNTLFADTLIGKVVSITQKKKSKKIKTVIQGPKDIIKVKTNGDLEFDDVVENIELYASNISRTSIRAYEIEKQSLFMAYKKSDYF